MKRCIQALVLALATVTGTAAGAAPLEALQSYFESVNTLRGTFVQTTRNDSGALIERATGHFSLRRPGEFNWVYETPYAQRIVATGKWLWVNDRDLRQVTVRPLGDVLGVGPALLLSGSFHDLREQFHMSVGDDGWIRLQPRNDRWSVQSVRLRMNDGVPGVLRLEDGLGQTVRLELSALERNVTLPEDVFATEVPEGSDLIAPPEYEAQGG